MRGTQRLLRVRCAARRLLPVGSRPPSLRWVLAAATASVALLAAALTGVTAWQAAGRQAEHRERDQLGRQAQALARLPALSTLLAQGAGPYAQVAGVRVAVIAPDGSVSGPAAAVLTHADRDTLLAGHELSSSGSLGGEQILVEGRPGRNGGAAVLTRPATYVQEAVDGTRRALVLPLLIGLCGAALVGAVAGGRIARPLATAAAAAGRLAAGERGLPGHRPGGTAEADALHHSLAVLDAALADAEQRQREFLLSVSHEIRTPLTVVTGYAEALADGVVAADEAAQVGTTLLSETHRLEAFTSDLLALARLEADDFRLDPAPTDLADVLGQAAAAWRVKADEYGVVLRTELPAGPVEAVTDGFRVRQLLDGLIGNALRVVPAGAPVVLALRAGEPGGPDGPQLQVRDGGPGLAPEDEATAFRRGVLRDRYRATRPVGSGLGLAIADKLAARLGGRITVVGHGPEGGACFTVRLPPADAY
ncbi:HAMP domain-containing sensor histidine kinase [Streptomyces sp. NPDC048342]|uniref:HAMP domain-containing sensor histidine kinase n=1 Tax=unclassified Streptomyces TaxID=2593676 RepID=UPI0034346949